MYAFSATEKDMAINEAVEMEKITYREICPKDYGAIKKLIDEVWNLNQFCDNERELEDALNIYLQSSLLDISYGKAAILDGEVVGVLLGKRKGQQNVVRRCSVLWPLIKSGVSLLFHATTEMRRQLKNVLKISKAVQKMMAMQKGNFTGHIELLIVGDKTQGLGVGKRLVNDFISYALHGNHNKIYVQTDTQCNYRFYEHLGFERLDSIDLTLNGGGQITLFLYQYKQG